MEDDPISMFVSITGAETQVAERYLEAYDWNMDRAVDHFMENSADNHHIHTPQHHDPLEESIHPPVETFLPENPISSERPAIDLTDEEFFDANEAEEVEPEPNEPVTQIRGHTSGVDLPEGVTMSDFNEARMLESAHYDIPLAEGSLDEYVAPARNPTPPRPPSPTTLATRELRQQQDAEFEESQRQDREKRLAAEEEKRKEHEEVVAEAHRKSQEAAAQDDLLREKESALPMEPMETDIDAIVIVIRFPDGAHCRRRFLRTDRTTSLFDFVDVHVNRQISPKEDEGTANGHKSQWWKLNGYDLVTRFPRKVIEQHPDQVLSLEDAGLNSKQETLFVELK